MKKCIVLAALILGFALMTTAVSAQTSSSDKSTTVQAQKGGNFTDSNKDGVCDHHQGKGKAGSCTKYADKNADGKCDNCGTGGCGKGVCAGKCAPQGNCAVKSSCNGCSKNHGKGLGPCGQAGMAQPGKK